MASIPERMNPRHYRILDMTLQGVPQSVIAAELGISSNNICTIVTGPSFQHELALRRSSLTHKIDDQIAGIHQQVEDRLKNASLAAADKLCVSLDSPDEQVAVKSALELLDRTGHQKVNKIESKSSVLVLNAEDLARIEKSLELDREVIENAEVSQV